MQLGQRTRASVLGFLLAMLSASCSLQSQTVPAVSPAQVQSASAYIVQASSVEAARKAVEAVGGVVTHDLTIIRAVGATLYPDQVEGLRSQPDVRQVFEDATVTTSSSCAVVAGPMEFDDKKFEWTVTNNGHETVTIGAISIAWPGDNDELKKIKFDGDEIWATEAEPPYLQISDGWHDDVRRRQLVAGDSARLRFEFDEDIDWTESNYSIFVDFEEGCTLEFTPRAAECRSDGLGYREFKDKKIKWSLPNNGADSITISKISLNWPEENGQLKKIKLDGDEIFAERRDAPVATIVDGWHSELRRRRIAPGDSHILEIEFDEDINVDESAYTLIVEYAEGCRSEFATESATLSDSLFSADSSTETGSESATATNDTSASSTSGSSDTVSEPQVVETPSGCSTVDSTVLQDNSRGPDKKARETHYVHQVGADLMHGQGVTGSGVTVAILDTGVWTSGGGKNWLRKGCDGQERILRAYDAITGVEGNADIAEDKNGHGSHVTSIILSSRKAQASGRAPQWNGVAPGVSLVAVKAFDETGNGTYLDVIRGIDWAVRNKDIYGIRVLNLSLSAPPRSHYWDDPLNQAVMEAWRAGVVVVASAGNTGPEAMSIGVPGNVPYVITVGAVTDNKTPFDPSDDRIASFSAAGPTHEGFVKPEMVAPGGHVLGMMNKRNKIPNTHKDFHDGNSYYYMSGTSQSTAVVSGVVALMLEAEPALTPDQVKCKLMSGARPATNADGSLAVSVFEQGAGLVDAARSVASTSYSCANRGLDIHADLAGTRHFGGRANRDQSGNYYLMGLDGYLWTDERLRTGGYLWTDRGLTANGFLWTDGYLWTDMRVGTDGYLWTDGKIRIGGYLWTSGYLWTDGDLLTDAYLWTDRLTEEMAVNFWVDQE